MMPLRVRLLQDWNDMALLAVGDDPHAAEKRRFLRQTESLRDELADRVRREGLVRLPECTGLWWRRTCPAALRLLD